MKKIMQIFGRKLVGMFICIKTVGICKLHRSLYCVDSLYMKEPMFIYCAQQLPHTFSL